MKFSYTLLKQFVPKIKTKAQVIEALTMHAFEAEDAGGDTIEIKLPPNRYADASSHIGIARELEAIFGLTQKKSGKKLPLIAFSAKLPKPDYSVNIQDKRGCIRYGTQYFENIRVANASGAAQKILASCGIRPINNVVDVMNYVMVEVGQPLHAFDADKINGKKLIVRKAKRGEKIVGIDGVTYVLDETMTVIADAREALAIAGIKGGKHAEVTAHTKKVIVEAANFDPVSIYKTSQALGLKTDASIRFAHGLDPNLVLLGLERTAYLLVEHAGAKPFQHVGVYGKDPHPTVLKFDLEKCNALLGTHLKEKEASNFLLRLGFAHMNRNMWQVPSFRSDIKTHEDVTEEIARLYGYEHIASKAPVVAMRPSESDPLLSLKETSRRALLGFGFDEVYNYSFVSESDAHQGNFWPGKPVRLKNPISAEFALLRPTLAYRLMQNISSNERFYAMPRVFEMGHIFDEKDAKSTIRERNMLGIALKEKEKTSFFELKGIVSELFEAVGFSDVFMPELGVTTPLFSHGVRIEIDHAVLGYVAEGKHGISVAEIDLERFASLLQAELEFQPIKKYPAVMRDISLLADATVRIGEVMSAIEELGGHIIEDVDLVDEYVDPTWGGKQSITLRIVFRSEDKTLSTEDVEREMKKIAALLNEKFKVAIR